MAPDSGDAAPALAPLDPTVSHWEGGDAEARLLEATAAVERFGVGGVSGGASARPVPWLVAEAVSSSQIAGVRTDRSGVLAHLALSSVRRSRDLGAGALGEAESNVRALESALEEAGAGSDVDIATIKKAHAMLADSRPPEPRRKAALEPGELRRNRITPGAGAAHEPPRPAEIMGLLDNLMDYANAAECADDALVRCAVAQCRLEEIRPFPDDNGRVARIFVALLMRKYGLLSSHALDLSVHLEPRAKEYHGLVASVRESGDWHPWIGFFLESCVARAGAGLDMMGRLGSLYDSHAQTLRTAADGAEAQQLVNMIFDNPYVSVPAVKRVTGLSNRCATNLIGDAIDAGVLERLDLGTKTALYLARGVLDTVG